MTLYNVAHLYWNSHLVAFLPLNFLPNEIWVRTGRFMCTREGHLDRGYQKIDGHGIHT